MIRQREAETQAVARGSWTRRLRSGLGCGRRRGRWVLLAWMVVAAFVWLGLLPHLAELPTVAQRIGDHEARGIDPAAIFYTEQVWQGDSRARHRTAMWMPSFTPVDAAKDFRYERFGRWTEKVSAEIFRKHE